MKVRTDFVTNSSSSSYVGINIESPLLAEIFRNYNKRMEEEHGGEGVVFDVVGEKNISFEAYDGPFNRVPKSVRGVVSALCALIAYLIDDGYCAYEADEPLRRLANTLKARRDEITNSIQSVEWEWHEDNWDEFSDEDGNPRNEDDYFTYTRRSNSKKMTD